MKIKWAVLAGIVVTGAALVASAAAFQDDNGWMRQRASVLMIRGVERELGINDTQREQIKAILKTEQPAIQALAVRVHDEKEQLQSQPAFDEAYVRAFALQHESTLADVLVEQEKVRAEIRAVLTTDQQQKADQMRQFYYARFTDRLTTLGDQI